MSGAGPLTRAGLARAKRNPVSSIALLLLVALTAATASAGVGLAATTLGATDRLFDAAHAPDYVQMHTGALGHDERSAIDRFADTRPDVTDHQVSTVLQLANERLSLGSASDAARSDAARSGVMEVLLATQNERFDLLLGDTNEPLRLGPGDIAVPVFYMQEYGLRAGDRVALRLDSGIRELTIASALRDAQMNPSIVNSKRFLVSEADWAALALELPEQQLITFRFGDTSGTEPSFEAAYRAAGLPANGPAVDGSLLRLVTALTDGVTAALLIAVSLVLFVLSALCLRLVILTTLERERRRVGLLRTLGFSAREVIRAELAGYAAIAFAGAGVGFTVGWPLVHLLSAPVRAYSGAPPNPVPALAAELIAALATAAAAVVLAALLLRRVRRVSPISVLRDLPESRAPRRRAPRFLAYPGGPLPLWLAVRSRLARPAGAVLLATIIASGTALALTPARITQTIAAPSFVTTMGVGASDVRVFLPGAEDAAGFAALVASLERDGEVAAVAASASYRVGATAGVVAAGAAATSDTTPAAQAEPQQLAVEVIDATAFPVEYRTGRAASGGAEIALSALAAESLGVRAGDEVTLDWFGWPVTLTVSGTYQDITNGGRSAKTELAVPASTGVAPQPVWYAIALDARDGVDVSALAARIAAAHPGATVTEMDRFVEQTLGGTARQLGVATGVVGAFGLALVLLVVALQGRLEIARDERGLRTMRLVGYGAGQVRASLVWRTICVAVPAALLGAVLAEVLGPGLLGAVLASVGGGATPLAPAGPLVAVIPVGAIVAATVAALLAAKPLPAPLAER